MINQFIKVIKLLENNLYSALTIDNNFSWFSNVLVFTDTEYQNILNQPLIKHCKILFLIVIFFSIFLKIFSLLVIIKIKSNEKEVE